MSKDCAVGIVEAMRVAIVGGPASGRARWSGSSATCITTESYGEGEKGVWDPRVLEDIAAGRNAVGVTAYFGRAVRRELPRRREHDHPGKVIFFEGARITLEAHMAEYPAADHLASDAGAGDWRRLESGSGHRPHLEHVPPSKNTSGCGTGRTRMSRTWCGASG